MSEQLRPDRRTVIVGTGLGAMAAAVAVAACSSPSTTSASEPASSEAAGSGPLTATTAVPVGSGIIVDDLVVTQPTAGVFKGFSAACPHAGCNVSKVTDGKIICPCHGSAFNLDGSVDKGPATKPLESKTISVQGDSIVAG